MYSQSFPERVPLFMQNEPVYPQDFVPCDRCAYAKQQLYLIGEEEELPHSITTEKSWPEADDLSMIRESDGLWNTLFPSLQM